MSNKKLLAAGLMIGALLAAPAGASVIYQLEPGLIVNNNALTPPQADAAAELANDPLFANGVDVLGKWDNGTTPAFTVDSGVDDAGDLPSGIFFTDAAIAVTVTGSGLDTTYAWELTENTANWDIVKIGVKQGQTTGYFLIDPFDAAVAVSDPATRYLAQPSPPG